VPGRPVEEDRPGGVETQCSVSGPVFERAPVWDGVDVDDAVTPVVFVFWTLAAGGVVDGVGMPTNVSGLWFGERTAVI